jgi:uncharacterized LabA/DUF88 family protein
MVELGRVVQPVGSYRWMLFVDGENFTLQAEAVAEERDIPLLAGPYYQPHVFMWWPGLAGTQPYSGSDEWSRNMWDLAAPRAVRAYYYTSTTGGAVRANECRDAIWMLDFTPHVFTKERYARSKEVDITLARDVLGHGYRNDYDLVVIAAGDRDYVPLVNEIKRLGKVVVVMFFRDKVAAELRYASDHFAAIDSLFEDRWKEHAAKAKEQGEQPSPPESQETVDP